MMQAVERLRRALLRRARTDATMLALGAATGLGTGVLAAALVRVIALVQGLAFGPGPGPLRVLLVPAAGALLVGLLLHWWVPEAGGSGVLQVMSTIALRAGRVRARVPFGGVAASGLALGTGASGGREGPIVLIGGGLGSVLGRLVGLDEARLRTLIAAGAAAGIGASFNAPIAGMLFAIELLLGSVRRALNLQVVVVAAVVGSVTARQLIGPGIIYRPDVLYRWDDPRELLLFALLGLAAVPVGLGLLYGEDAGKRLFSRLRLWPPLRLAAGGLALGLLALAVPEVLGTGDRLPPIEGVRDPIQRMLDGGYGVGWAAAGALLLLMVAKLVATCLSLGSGNAVGTFAPCVYMGAALGGAFGAAAAVLLPGMGIEPGAYALVGTATVFAAAARAPLTAILVAVELTGDYDMVLPLMLATGLATFVADRIQPDSLYAYFLRKKGVVYGQPEDVDVLQTVRVGEVMTTPPPAVDAATPVAELAERLAATRSHGLPVVTGGDRLVGVVAISDLSRAEGRADATAGEICTRSPLTVTPDDPVFRAVRRMATLDVGRLPVVSASDHGRLVGVIRRQDLVTAYQRALGRGLGVQHSREGARLRDLSGTALLEFEVRPQAPATGRSVRDIRWPARTILTSLHRDGTLVVPTADTVLQPGDRVVVLTDRDAGPDVHALLAGRDAAPDQPGP